MDGREEYVVRENAQEYFERNPRADKLVRERVREGEGMDWCKSFKACVLICITTIIVIEPVFTHSVHCFSVICYLLEDVNETEIKTNIRDGPEGPRKYVAVDHTGGAERFSFARFYFLLRDREDGAGYEETENGDLGFEHWICGPWFDESLIKGDFDEVPGYGGRIR